MFYSRLAGFAGELLNLTEAPEKLLNRSGALGLPALFSFFFLRTLRVRSPRNLNNQKPVLSIGGDHLDLIGASFNDINGAGPPEYSIRTDFVFERGEKRRYLIETAQQAKEVARMQLLNAVRALALDKKDSPRVAGIAVDWRRGACGDDRCGSPSPHFRQEGQ